MPQWERFEATPGATEAEPSDCPAQFAFCVTKSGAATLVMNLNLIRSVWNEVQLRCGVAPLLPAAKR